MMYVPELPISFWCHALKTTVILLNIVPSKAVEKTLYQMWMEKVPSMSFLRIWGSLCKTFTIG